MKLIVLIYSIHNNYSHHRHLFKQTKSITWPYDLILSKLPRAIVFVIQPTHLPNGYLSLLSLFPVGKHFSKKQKKKKEHLASINSYTLVCTLVMCWWLHYLFCCLLAYPNTEYCNISLIYFPSKLAFIFFFSTQSTIGSPLLSQRVSNSSHMPKPF